MIFPAVVRQQQADSPLCRHLHPTHIGISTIRGQEANRPEGEDTHILIFCTRGCGYVICEGRRSLVPTGHYLLIPAGVPHRYGNLENQDWCLNWLHFSGEQSHHYFQAITRSAYVAPIPAHNHEPIFSLYQELFHVITSSFELPNLAYASQILGNLLGALFFNPRLNRTDTISGNAIQTMKQHLNTQITLEDLAKDAGMSRTHFSVVFKKETGFSPIDYFNHLKIRWACRLLDDSSYNIGEVGRKVGIENIHYFSRLFSKIMGMSPSAYRKLPIG